MHHKLTGVFMLTDEEIMALRNKCSHENGVIISMDFAREIERAVLAKAGEQKPDYWKIGGLGGDVITNKKSELDLAERFNWPVEPLYKHPLPAQAIPEGWQLVPVNPTESQRQAMYMAAHFDMAIKNPDEWRAVDQSYAAMLSASPKP
jgi:hypothetical protein